MYVCEYENPVAASSAVVNVRIRHISSFTDFFGVVSGDLVSRPVFTTGDFSFVNEGVITLTDF